MVDMNAFSEAYKNMSQEDKAALRKLQKEESERLGVPVGLGDMVRAVTPGLPTPEIYNGLT